MKIQHQTTDLFANFNHNSSLPHDQVPSFCPKKRRGVFIPNLKNLKHKRQKLREEALWGKCPYSNQFGNCRKVLVSKDLVFIEIFSKKVTTATEDTSLFLATFYLTLIVLLWKIKSCSNNFKWETWKKLTKHRMDLSNSGKAQQTKCWSQMCEKKHLGSSIRINFNEGQTRVNRIYQSVESYLIWSRF